jgi:hypothetical protein
MASEALHAAWPGPHNPPDASTLLSPKLNFGELRFGEVRHCSSSELLPQEGPDTSRMYQGFLMYTTPQTYIRNPAAQDRQTANRKRKSRVAGPWRGGVRWRPGLTNNQIVLPRRTSVYAAHQLFSKRLMP